MTNEVRAEKKYKNLTDADKEYIRVIHANSDLSWDSRMQLLINRFSKSERTVRKWIEKLGFSKHTNIENEEVRAAKLKKYNSKYYIVTWAQNATPVHKTFWDNVLTYGEYLGAEVVVIQGRFQNPTSLWTKNMENDEWWDETFTIRDSEGSIVKTYLDCSRQNVNTYLDILADVKIRPTASNPLNGLEGVSGDRTSIVGHPRVHLKSLPVLNGHPNKLLLTTGACTIKNYSDTREGKIGEFHHTYGFVVVEIKDDKKFFIRQVTAGNDGAFTDLNIKVKSSEIHKISTCKGFVMGDIHVSQVHKPVVDKTLELFKVIKPEYVVLHDVFNGESINHHESKDPIKSYHRMVEGKNSLANELQEVYHWIRDNKLDEYGLVIPYANHHCWIDRYLSCSDWKQDITNAKEYLELALMAVSGEAPQGIFCKLVKDKFPSTLCLGPDDSFRIGSWEVGQHGHLGVHGSKGSIEQNRKLNTKIIVGDFHQPSRKDNSVGVGTYTQLRMGYNNGASAWMHCGAIIHNDGKVQQIIFIDDEFTTLF